MKTPEQIADSIFNAERGAWAHGDPARVRLLVVSAIEADRAQRADAPVYKVGDPDPTPSFIEANENYCEAARREGVELWACTWTPNHPGTPHVAGDGEIIRAVWA